MTAIQIILYVSILVLIIGIIAKAIRISRMPAHLRWDLYPIPHEKSKAAYGGSYYEESNWWTRPREVSLTSEVKEMSKEIFAIQSLYRHNRSLWYFSFPFHIGLYLLCGFCMLLILGAIAQGFNIGVTGHSYSMLGRIIYYLTLFAGVAGWILGIIGSVGLLISRMIRNELRTYSTRGDYFNLLLLLALFIFGFASWLTADKTFSLLRWFVSKFFIFEPTPPLPVITSIQLYLAAAFFAYLPFTHMTHFVGKYFTYHKVRWQDEPSSKGGTLETAISANLGEKQTWSAAHIKRGARWSEAATDQNKSPEKGDK
jgi:nitrate reductase gamma subunit